MFRNTSPGNYLTVFIFLNFFILLFGSYRVTQMLHLQTAKKILSNITHATESGDSMYLQMKGHMLNSMHLQ